MVFGDLNSTINLRFSEIFDEKNSKRFTNHPPPNFHRLTNTKRIKKKGNGKLTGKHKS